MNSYWQIGCNHGRAGKPMALALRYCGGYSRGYDWGQRQAQRERVEAYQRALPDPPLKNPYMDGIEAVEGILRRLQTFAREFPGAIDKAQQDEYRLNMLEVRDTLHRFRQAEMAEDPTERRERLKVALAQVFDWK